MKKNQLTKSDLTRTKGKKCPVLCQTGLKAEDHRRGFIINLPQPQQNKIRHFAPMCNVQVAQFSNNTNRANQAT